MEQVEFRSLGRNVSCLGLGCARLDGRAGLRRSTKIIQTALELGITYFDVAPSYGTAEEAIGHVIGNRRDVVVATKIGPPLTVQDPVKTALKELLRPTFDRFRTLKMMLKLVSVQRDTVSPHRARYDFSSSAIDRSIEASRRRLQRDSIDVLLAHEPNRLDLAPDADAYFQSLVEQRLIGAFGVGVNAIEDSRVPFGSIWQSGWPGAQAGNYSNHMMYIFHGVIRFAERDRLGRTVDPVPELIRRARRVSPNSILLVSASTPARLCELARAVTEPS